MVKDKESKDKLSDLGSDLFYLQFETERVFKMRGAAAITYNFNANIYNSMSNSGNADPYIVGGIASAIGGTGLGVVAATDTMIENERKQNRLKEQRDTVNKFQEEFENYDTAYKKIIAKNRKIISKIKEILEAYPEAHKQLLKDIDDKIAELEREEQLEREKKRQEQEAKRKEETKKGNRRVKYAGLGFGLMMGIYCLLSSGGEEDMIIAGAVIGAPLLIALIICIIVDISKGNELF